MPEPLDTTRTIPGPLPTRPAPRRPAAWTRLPWIALACLALGACQKSALDDRLPTYPVKGQVLVDGQPAAQLKVKAYRVGGLDKANPALPQAITDDQGNFTLFTYNVGDGIPTGQYALTFVWGQANGSRYSGPDKLAGRYADPQNPLKTVQVADKPIDLGQIQLATH